MGLGGAAMHSYAGRRADQLPAAALKTRARSFQIVFKKVRLVKSMQILKKTCILKISIHTKFFGKNIYGAKVYLQYI